MNEKIEYFDFGAEGGGSIVWLLENGEVEETRSSMDFEEDTVNEWQKNFPSWLDWWQGFKKNNGLNWISFHVVYIHPNIRSFIRAEVRSFVPQGDWQKRSKKNWLKMASDSSPIKITEFKSLNFSIGGYFAANIDITINDGYLVLNSFKFAPESGTKSERKLTQDELIELIESMNTARVTEWEKAYDAPLLDGIQWTLKLTYNRRKRHTSTGSNAYPAHFDYFLATLKKLSGINNDESSD